MDFYNYFSFYSENKSRLGRHYGKIKEEKLSETTRCRSSGQGKKKEETKPKMKKTRKDVTITNEPVVEDKDSSKKVDKPKKVNRSKVKSNKNIKSAKGNGKEKANKPKKDPVNDHQLNNNENSVKPEVNNNKELEIKPKTKMKDDTKPKTKVIVETITEEKGETKPKTEAIVETITEEKGETKPKTEVINEELVDNEKAFHEVNKWMDPSYGDLPDHLTDHKNPVDQEELLKKFLDENTMLFRDAQYRSLALHNAQYKYKQSEHYILELESKIKAMEQEMEERQPGQKADVPPTEADKITKKRQQEAKR